MDENIANTMKNLDGLYKQVYADGVEKLIPECSMITKAVPFRETEKLGDWIWTSIFHPRVPAY